MDFNASVIDSRIQNDFVIYHFNHNQYQKAFVSKKLLKLFPFSDLDEDKSQGLVHVKRKSNINYAPIIQDIKDYYEHYYPTIFIQDISFTQKTFIKKLPSDYVLSFKPKAYLYAKSSLKIQSPSIKKKFFLSYKVFATIKAFKASHNINRGKILSLNDVSYEAITFTRLKALPLRSFTEQKVRLKKRLIKGKLLYLSDIENLPLVIKGESVNVRLISGQVRLEFQAIALADGHIGDEISIKKKDGKKLRAKVISFKLVEIQ
ncbi:flagellar basal body P-ring formation protein FlgA [Sulfurimonas sp. MAG313]|nr:flagellar basal body P-ring formation chaperone FlgA [Sulfurimonas sp. MAG313]MDF1882127.1 flagellar basal body P-ring formation protein FlgA [Sulfurimonas sp. MAG313]